MIGRKLIGQNLFDLRQDKSISIINFGLFQNFLAVLALTVYSGNVSAIDPVEMAKLLPSDGIPGAGAGRPISISGETAVIGAVWDDEIGYQAGAAYVFVRSSQTWIEQRKLTAIDGTPGDFFGGGVSIHGDYIVVGSPRKFVDGYQTGAAYVFVRSGQDWSQQAKLVPQNGATLGDFGERVSIDGDIIIVSAPRDNISANWNAGSAYIFTRNGTTWNQEAKLLASDGQPGDQFGGGVDIDGNTAAVGAHYDDDNGVDSGSAYIFVRANGLWSQQAKLLASDGSAKDFFGLDVSIHGDTLAVGAGLHDDNVSNSGAVFTFERNGTMWTQQGEVYSDDPQGWVGFGRNVSVQNDTLAVGELGVDKVHIFNRTGSSWNRTATVVPSDGKNKYYGASVSVDGNYVGVSAQRDDDNGNDAGAAYIYSLVHLVSTCSGFESPMDGGPVAVNGNRALPLKATLLDQDGLPTNDTSVLAPPVVQVWYEFGTVDATDVSSDALPAGQGTDGNQFFYTGGGTWQYNLRTRDYTAPGRYSIFFESGDSNSYVIQEPTCLAEFIVN